MDSNKQFFKKFNMLLKQLHREDSDELSELLKNDLHSILDSDPEFTEVLDMAFDDGAEDGADTAQVDGIVKARKEFKKLKQMSGK